uniref:Uncharacterized protein n=1 Tax=Arundo donax TaxID=35708 RepID=A0A0A9EBU7_ARUDO
MLVLTTHEYLSPPSSTSILKLSLAHLGFIRGLLCFTMKKFLPFPVTT